MAFERSNPEGLFQPPDESAYTQVITTEIGDKKLIMVAGTCSKNEEGKLMYAGDIHGQTRYVLEQLERCLESEGADMTDVIRRRIFVLDVDEFIDSEAIKIFPEFWPDGQSATSTMVEVNGLAKRHHQGPAEGVDHADPEDDRFLIEIDVTAVTDQ